MKLKYQEMFSTFLGTVEPDDSKPLDSKLLALVNFLPLTN